MGSQPGGRLRSDRSLPDRIGDHMLGRLLWAALTLERHTADHRGRYRASAGWYGLRDRGLLGDGGCVRDGLSASAGCPVLWALAGDRCADWTGDHRYRLAHDDAVQARLA